MNVLIYLIALSVPLFLTGCDTQPSAGVANVVAVEPPTGSELTQVVISGTGFLGASEVKFQTAAGSSSVFIPGTGNPSDTLIVVNAPAPPAPGVPPGGSLETTVVVINNNLASTGTFPSNRFTYIA